MPADLPTADILSISALTQRVKNLLESQVGRVWVAGEISNWRVSPAGHAYFTLKDDRSQIDAVMFRGSLSRLQFAPKGGIEVVVQGEVTVYEKRGNYQIICREMQPKGVGALQLAFERLKRKLGDEGLFDEDRKQPLPMLPQRIGIVTSPTGAAIRDILHVIERRFANVHILLYPARVQGDEAAQEIAAGIAALDSLGVDVLIVGRGGGSLEDLWPFNEEAVVRAIAACKTPLISAVGHEVDFTLSDFAADVRAPTPSAAAEIVVREHQALAERVRQLEQGLARGMSRFVETARFRLDRARASYYFQRPEELVRDRRQASDELRMRLDESLADRLIGGRQRLAQAARSLTLLSPARQVERADERLRTLRRRLGYSGSAVLERARPRVAPLTARLRQAGPAAIERNRARVRPLAAHLDALSPLRILARGYSVTRRADTGAVVHAAAEVQVRDAIRITLGQGEIRATVDAVEE